MDTPSRTGYSLRDSIDDHRGYGGNSETEGLLGSRLSRRLRGGRLISDLWFNILTFVNIGLCLFLFMSLVLVAQQAQSMIVDPEPPYSPVREAGAVKYINTRYKPQKIFQSSPSKEVDEAWDGWLREHDHLIMIPKAEAIKHGLPESVEPYLDPGYAPYGLAVYHQMHCLNRLRKTFYPEIYFPNDEPEMLEFHRNHCFDMIRQAILCHGDVALLYWWNANYTYVDDTGTKHYTDEYLQRTPEERDMGSFATWDTPVQCRDLDAINTWVKSQNVMDDDKYGGQEID